MKQEDLQLTGGGKKENRRELDFYPTPSEVTIALMNFLITNNILPTSKETVIWEPACGNGAMANIISSYGYLVMSSDIAKETDINGIQFPAGNSSTDFLDDNIKTRINCEGITAIITNPPFNKSEEFIRKALEYSPIVCMLLKSQYWHAKKRYKLFTEKKPAYVLPLTWRPDFLEHERKNKKGSPTMEVAWSVWTKNSIDTKYIPLIKPNSIF